jgi:hypothetical protein
VKTSPSKEAGTADAADPAGGGLDAERETDALYDLAPDEFTQARDALVKRLKAAKRADEARQVSALRRPTVVAWAVNQLARRRRDAVQQLLSETAALARAQHEALSGGDPGAFRDATRQRRDTVRRLASEAAALAGGDAHLDAITATLEAASADPDLADELRSGRMTREAVAGGFGLFAPSAPVERAAPRAAAKRAKTAARAGPAEAATPDEDRDDERAEAEAAAAAARDEVEARGRDAQTARATAASARAAADDARRAAEEAQRVADEARQAAEQAEGAASDAAGHEERAREALTSAEDELRDAEAALAELDAPPRKRRR